jgi:hypothetical protein
VGDTGLEPMTSSVSGKRATNCANRPRRSAATETFEVETGFEPAYTALQAAASPLGHSTAHLISEVICPEKLKPTRADDEIRTRDPHLGKVMRYRCATSALLVFCLR